MIGFNARSPFSGLPSASIRIRIWRQLPAVPLLAAAAAESGLGGWCRCLLARTVWLSDETGPSGAEGEGEGGSRERRRLGDCGKCVILRCLDNRDTCCPLEIGGVFSVCASLKDGLNVAVPARIDNPESRLMNGV